MNLTKIHSRCQIGRNIRFCLLSLYFLVKIPIHRLISTNIVYYRPFCTYLTKSNIFLKLQSSQYTIIIVYITIVIVIFPENSRFSRNYPNVCWFFSTNTYGKYKLSPHEIPQIFFSLSCLENAIFRLRRIFTDIIAV